MQIHPQVYIGQVQSTFGCGNSAIYKHQVDGLLSLGSRWG